MQQTQIGFDSLEKVRGESIQIEVDVCSALCVAYCITFRNHFRKLYCNNFKLVDNPGLRHQNFMASHISLDSKYRLNSSKFIVCVVVIAG